MTKIRINRDVRTDPEPVETEFDAEVVFLMGAIKAARYVSPKIRDKILEDVQLHTQTSADQLRFLFAADNNNQDHSVFDLPNAERRRMIIRKNLLEAAE